MTEQIRIYRPTITEENPLALGREELSYAPKLLEASQDGLIKVKLEEDVIIQRVSHDLYANAESGFRELYNNEARACRISAKQFGASPRIEITLVPSQRKLVIHGIDSLGISQEKFLELYRYLGRTDNWEGDEVGMWGLGKASYSTLSDIMVLETFSREDGTKYAVLGKNGIGYNLLPAPQDLNEYGTRITITLRQDIRIESLLPYIARCAKFPGIETHLNLSEDFEGPYYGDEEPPKKAGRYRLGPEKYEEYLKGIVEKKKYYYEAIARYIPVDIDDDEFSLHAAIVLKKDGTEDLGVVSSGRYVSQTYLLGTPIGSSSISLPFCAWLLNIKDERKYRPTTDRERLSEKAEELMMERLKPRVVESLSFLEARSVGEYLALSPDYQAVLRDHEELKLERYLSAECIDLCDFVNVRVKTRGSGDTLSIADLLKRSTDLFYLPSLNENKVSLVKDKLPGAVVFKLRRRSDEDTVLDLMLRHGVRLADEFISEQKLKIQKKQKTVGEVVVHEAGTGSYSWGRFECVRKHTERENSEALDDRTVRVPRGKMSQYLPILSTIRTNYRITVDRPWLVTGITVDDFVRRFASKKVFTSIGPLSFEEVARSTRPISIGLYSDPSLASHYHGTDLIIFGDEDLVFELDLFLTHLGVAHEIDASGRKGFDAEIGRRYYASEFIHYADYEKPGEAEILYSVIHIEKEVKEEKLRDLFLNAARHSKDPKEIREMREYVLSLNRLVEAHKDELPAA